LTGDSEGLLIGDSISLSDDSAFSGLLGTDDGDLALATGGDGSLTTPGGLA
jgi:hypothetical protein